MRNQIHFREARPLHPPVVGAEGNQVPEQRAGLGSSVETMAHTLLTLFEPALDLARAEVKHAPLGRSGEAEGYIATRGDWKG